MGCGSSKNNVEAAKDATGAKEGGAPGEKKPSGGVGTPEMKANQEDIRDKYELGKVLGSGSFGQVREAKLKGGESSEIRAVKMIEPDKGDGEWSNQAIFVREVGLLQQMKHENIIRYYDFYEDIHFLYVVMELCKGGEVFNKIVEMKRFSEKNAAHIGTQMLKSMDYIHKLNIAHRDIKAENFMLSEPSVHSNVKMIDFGMATKFKADQVLTELCGSPHYLSPELIGQKYNHLADVWAFGVLMYLLMYGHYPYDAKHPRDIMVKILTEPIKWESKAKLSKEAIEFLKRLLEHNIKKRMTAEQAMEHSWMSKFMSSTDEGEVLCQDATRSAHKKITANKRTVSEEVEKLRNQKMQKIDEDFGKGVRHGKRIGETPKEEYMSKPEFVRRENKITTAPSSEIKARRSSIMKLKDMFSGNKNAKPNPGGLQTITDGDEDNEDDVVDLPPGSPGAGAGGGGGRLVGKGRSASVQLPRRLSCMPSITKQDEDSFWKLYEEKKEALDTGALSGVVPGGGGAGAVAELPGQSPEKKKAAESPI